jgi:hypothetical protein
MKSEELVHRLLAGHKLYIDTRTTGGTFALAKQALTEFGYEVVIPETNHRAIANLEAVESPATAEVVLERMREIRREYYEQHKAKTAERERTVAELRERRVAEREQLDRNGHTVEAMRKPTTMLGVPGMDRTLPLATPPMLGEQVQVFAMVLLDDGRLRMGLQDGGHRWVVDVVGEMEREEAR